MTIFHVDMDAFYASIEIRDNPVLADKPVLVGGTGKRGVVAAANYVARRYGCHSAQPMAVALRRCPDACVFAPRFSVYESVSRQIFAIFEQFSPTIEALSIDEAFLDLSGCERLLGPPRRVAEDLRAAVHRATGGLTCSVGISQVKFIAKIASGHRKPDGVTLVEPGEELSFLHRLPIQTLWGVGRVTQQRLRKHQIATIGDIARTDLAQLQRWFGEHGRRLHELSQGIDPRRVESNRQRKQISHEDTYALDLVGLEAIRERLLSQATRVADRLVTKGRRGRCVHLKIRDTAFTTETRQRVLPEPTQHARVIYATACDLLGAIQTDGRRFRLTGVGISDLVEARCPAQLDLPLSDPRPDRLQGVLTEIRQRYGHQALYPASAGGELRRGSAGAASRSIDREDDSNRSK